MSTSYRVYANDGAGGPVDDATPIADQAATTLVVGPLAAGDHSFLVRPYDTGSGLENQNTDARLRVVLDAAGLDATGRPDPPTGLAARPLGLGGVRVAWHRLRPGSGGEPTTFRVWATAGATVDYGADPAATIDLADPDSGFTAADDFFWIDLAGLAGGSAYAIGVRASNASGEESNTDTVAVVPDAAAPDPVDELAATPTFG